MKLNTSSSIFIILLSIIIQSCNNVEIVNTSLLQGIVKNHENRVIYFYLDNEEATLIDSFQIAIDGTFEIKKEAIDKVGFYFLELKPNTRIPLFLTPSDYIEIHFDANDILKSLRSNTSQFHNELWNIEYNNHQFAQDIDLITNTFKENIGKVKNDSILNSIKHKKDSIIQIYRAKSDKIIDAAESPIITFWALQQKHGNNSLYTLENDLQLFFENAETLIKDETTKLYFEEYDNYIVQIYANNLSEKRFGIGNKFPQLKAENVWGDQLILDDIPSKITHIILWDHSNSASINKIDEIRSLIRNYRSKGLNTIMISYNENKSDWNSKIKQLKIPCIQLIDPLGTSSYDLTKMGITFLPHNFILNNTGHIISRNQWGEEVDKTIKEFLKKY